MQSHAAQIQAILARELDEHRAPVHAGLLIVPPRTAAVAGGGARVQGSAGR
ncbi:MAG: hypothetical protein JWQ20_3995 [Conexibacter sp.]|nr:hypothetical protein [Conexibacter sp.]